MMGDITVAELGRLVAAGSITMELSDVEFLAYLCSLRLHWQEANTARMGDWEARARAVDALHEVRAALGATSTDTAHLWAVWESRKVISGWARTYSLTLTGPVAEVAVLALAEFAEGKVLSLCRDAAALLARISKVVRSR